MTRTALIVSPYFPPSTLAGVHRGRHLAKHLPAFGWRPLVVRVDARHYTQTADPALAALVPDSVEQVRTGAWPASLTRLAKVSDIGLRAYAHLEGAVHHAILRERPDVVLITGSPFYPLLMARRIKRRHGIPVILDFQDPWVSGQGAREPAWSKAGLSHRLAMALEPHAVRHADAITSVSEGQNDEMIQRYPWLAGALMAAIPIGGDPEDFASLEASPMVGRQVTLDPARINLSYVGAFLPNAAPLVRVLFQACRALRQSDAGLASRLRLNFVGTSNQPDDHTGFRVAPIAEEEGVGDLVTEIPQRIPFLDALNVLVRSHGLLLIGSDEAHYTASKIYPAMMSKRPYLSMFHQASSAHAILSAAGGGRALAFADDRALAELVPTVSQALRQLAADPQSLGSCDPAAYAAYTAHAVTGRFAALFDQVSAARERL